ncbi:peptide chain release factor N(5)-glutamine methyltransferase [Roseivivax isoporae]|uniref:peptide chain release factor N(5)-glutamine methyltransferase n=1 Tax=Roseivivax isoporae TaxID=591206 RepID=UPI00068673DF|nr:peptide chain release factor N(5)-glutamine methyltransferase [Roseivivax isoporae]
MTDAVSATGADLVARATRALAAAGVPDPARDARRLLAHALGLAPGRVTLALPDPVAPGRQAAFDALVAARGRRVPVSHLVGERLFWGRAFAVGPAVLDPRPETETLVAAALARPFRTVLDLGTGSGCILLTLLAERPAAEGTGTDIDPAALEVAAGNAVRLGVEARARFSRGDWGGAVPAGARFDLVVSNPPYIAADEMAGLAPEVRNHEPRHALTDEGDGLSVYRHIAGQAGSLLSPGGRVLVEIGPDQGAAVAAIFETAGLSDIGVLPDFDGRDRVVTAFLA